MTPQEPRHSNQGGARTEVGAAPVEDTVFVRPFLKALRAHVDALARSMTSAHAGTADYAHAHRSAAAWVYTSAVVAWAEDHRLIEAWLRADAAPRRAAFLARPGSSMRGWLAHAIAALASHPATECLLDPRYNPLRDREPGEEAVRGLIEWWSARAPSLAYPAPERGPASITGWLLGDLLQLLTDERRRTHALCQTPWWVADLLCELTLVPAARDWPGQALRVIDPACGTGNLLVWAAIGLHQLYTTGTNQAPPLFPRASVERILAGVNGVELDPLTAATARLRLLVTAGALLAQSGNLDGPLRLDALPRSWKPRIAVGNALLAGQGDPHPPGTISDDTADYPDILKRGSYHAVIANPPYITVKNPETREAIRHAYQNVCSGRYPLSVPFAKLTFDLAIRNDPDPKPE